MLTKEQKEDIIKRLTEKAPNLQCPMCQTKEFGLAEGYFLNTLQPTFQTIKIDGPGIPTVAIICNNCGFVSQHALGRLGLLPKEIKKNTDESK